MRNRKLYNIRLAEMGLRSLDVAQALGWHISKLSRILLGYRNPSFSEMKALATFLQVRISALFPEAEKNE